MTRRARIGLVVAVLFGLVNLGGLGYAVAMGELLHSVVHAVLFAIGAYLAWRLLPEGRPSLRGRTATVDAAGVPSELTDRLTHLEQSVDVVAMEVERIGEGQRFMTRLFTEGATAREAGEGVAASVESERREGAADRQLP